MPGLVCLFAFLEQGLKWGFTVSPGKEGPPILRSALCERTI